ncbi:helix-turn-helix domain-containing protein [Verrucosispora sp. WMMD1129]|uniref:helix-turn-helix domain-containing protein n=1 Tax=Verrucosispora sp. WMMD1129 TaxID=3016093 RepID=UPI00249B4A90|nr:helix-turn-helix domain-containing protein [Verrucosispora sp. WMMD1129]WFE45341.1 helix-turn-helix domain-containing protein [Verrucosispora sp. WMMD1129]
MFGNEDPQIPENGESSIPYRLLYPVPEVAQLLSLSEREVWRLIDTGQLKSRKVGRRRLVHRDHLAAFASASGEPAEVAA